jgi:hypothetical protein
VRFDRLDPGGLDAAVEGLVGAGFQPWFALEAREEADCRARLAANSLLGLLDWPPMAGIGRPMKVRFHDPRDRQRFLAGAHVETSRDPDSSRAPR